MLSNMQLHARCIEQFLFHIKANAFYKMGSSLEVELSHLKQSKQTNSKPNIKNRNKEVSTSLADRAIKKLYSQKMWNYEYNLKGCPKKERLENVENFQDETVAERAVTSTDHELPGA